MSSNVARRGGKKNRKHSRFKLKCAAYASSHRREKNKARRLKRHLIHHPLDGCARACLKNLGY